MTPKDMTWLERHERDRRWNSSVDFGSPMSSWTPAMLAVRREFGEPKTAQDCLMQMAEARRRFSSPGLKTI